MVLKTGEQLYYGTDAIHAYALLSVPSFLFSRLNYWMFRLGPVAPALYPVMVTLLLNTKNNNPEMPGSQRFWNTDSELQ